MTRTILFFAAALATVACNQVSINTPIRSFDRPTDVALACVLDLGDHFEATNLEVCSPEEALKHIRQDPATGEDVYPHLRALVTQSARGEVALVDASRGRLVDVFPRQPGFGFLPVGKLPEHVRASRDGCVAVTTNGGSCDLSRVDLPQLYNMPLPQPDADAGTTFVPPAGEDVSQRLAITLPGGRRLGARPAWVEMVPQTDGELALRGWQEGGTPGMCAGGVHHAWVALPGCQLVVEVSLDPGATAGAAEVVSAIRVLRDRTEVVTDLASLTCADECSGGEAAPDLGAPPPVPDTQAFPGTLAVAEEGAIGRLFIGDLAGERISIVPYGLPPAGETPPSERPRALGVPRGVHLETGAGGVRVVRVSHRTPAGRFLYAVARDASVRVVDIDRELECETNPDPVQAGLLAVEDEPDPRPGAVRLGCYPLGLPSTPPRAPLARTPGIELPNQALPADVAFVHLDEPLPPTSAQIAPPSAGPTLLVGDFAWILSSDGRAAVVNVFDACPGPNIPQAGGGTYTPACDLGNVAPSRATVMSFPGAPEPLVLDRVSHRLRPLTDRFARPPSESDNAGTPRLRTPNDPLTVRVGSEARASGPDFPTLACGDGVACTATDPKVAFVDLDQVRNETWRIEWEGTIPGTQRTLGRPLPDGRFTDAGGAWCSRGVQAGDKLTLVGCEDDDECDPTQVCVRDPAAPASQPNGLCLDRAPELREAELSSCGPLLRGLRRYRIVSARQGVAEADHTTDQLVLAEISEPENPAETRTCVPGQDACGPLTLSDGSVIETSCLVDWDGQHRCLRPCDPSVPVGACGTDYVCATSRLDGAPRCVRAPLDDRYLAALDEGGFGCLRALQPYRIDAGDAFIVVGSVTGFLSLLEPDPTTRECVVPPMSSEAARLRQARIPLVPDVACPAGADIRAPLPPTVPNVCLRERVESEERVRVVHFENPFLSFGLRQPPGDWVPPPGLALEFVVLGGQMPFLIALGVDVAAQQPRAVAVAPDDQTVYVVDEGRQTAAVGLRGQLIKIISQVQATDRFFIVR